MDYSLKLRLPEDLRKPLVDMATAAGQTPEEWIATIVRQRLKKDERLRRHFGAVNLGAPTGLDNTRIDADLAQAYADVHEEP